MGTDYYANYQAEMDSLMAEMAATGFADAVQGEDGTTQYIVFKQRKLPGIDLPDLRVSGGDVRIETPKLTVNETTGSVTAKGNPKIQINSESELYLKVNNAVVEKNGGNVYLNDSKIDSNTPESNGLSGVSNIHAESSDNDTSSISITSTAANADP